MKNKFATLFSMIALTAATAVAQTADIEVSYSYRTISPKGVERTREYRLLANPHQSKYFNPNSEHIDSLCSTPQGKEQLDEVKKSAIRSMIAQGMIKIEADKFPYKNIYLYVVKSVSDSTIIVYDHISRDELVYYTEPYSEMTWTIGENTKNILGYDCTEATTDYHGRTWTAWFTPDIPISDGPWKFLGLPGLILEVSEPSGLYTFTAEGLEKSGRPIPAMYSAGSYDKTDRKTLLRAHRKALDNPMGALNAKGMRVQVNPSDLPKFDPNRDLIETDYNDEQQKL